jgi:anaerobic ribonucleoside-triphosphate reductase
MYGFEDLRAKSKKIELYKAVYESKEWLENIAPTVANLVDRNSILVHNLSSTSLSIMK